MISATNRFFFTCLIILFSACAVRSFSSINNNRIIGCGTDTGNIIILKNNEYHHRLFCNKLRRGSSNPYPRTGSGSVLSKRTVSFRGKSLTRRDLTRLTTSLGDDEGMNERKREKYIKKPIQKAIHKFKSRPGTYLLIPCVAAVVGWFTNWLAVQMIFYPVQYRGLSLYRIPEVPLGLIGWQGIVPCKTRPMSEAMVEMVTTQLLSVKEVFQRLDPKKVADLLTPEVPKLGQSIIEDLMPSNRPWSWISDVPKSLFVGLPSQTVELISHMNHSFLKDFTIAMQQNIDSLLNVRNCVVDQMVLDRTKLGELFQKCGSKELDFLTNSGLWFGFILGLIQMVVALFWDNPWSLSIGGGIVGLATNWLALKWIFEPVNPTKVGPFILQGQFLRRQKEVSAEFSKFFAENILTSKKMWFSILNDPTTTPAFHELFGAHLTKFAKSVSSGLGVGLEPEVLKLAAVKAIEKLPNHIGVLHSYVDEKLQLRETLRISMEKMSSAQFERVLHPIFEEDELTLIMAGAVLGFAAGLVQQGLETGKIQIPTLSQFWKSLLNSIHRLRSLKPLKVFNQCVNQSFSSLVNLLRRRGWSNVKKSQPESTKDAENSD